MSSSTWLVLSATECTDSASIDDDPVKRKAMNLLSAMPRVAPSAAKMARSAPPPDSRCSAMRHWLPHRNDIRWYCAPAIDRRLGSDVKLRARRRECPGVSDLSRIVKAYDVRGTVPDQLNEPIAEAIGRA